MGDETLTVDGVLLIGVGVVSRVPLVSLAVFAMLDDKDFFLAHF